MMSKLSLKGKLGVGFGTLLLVMVITATVALISLQRVAALSAAADRKALELANISAIQARINDQKSEVRGVVIGQKAEVERYANNDRVIADLFSKQEAMVTSDYGRQLLAGIREACEAYHRVQVRVLNLQNSKEAAALLFSPETNSLRDQMNQRISDFVDAASKLKQAASEEQAAATSRAVILVLGLTVLGVIIGLVLAVTIVRNITGRVAQMVAMIKAISANDLSRGDMIIRNHDELGTCGTLLNQMKNRLSEMIQSIAGTAEHVASASEEISSSATQQAQGAETQKDQTSQVATAMQEMASTVLQVSENSNKAAESSRQAAETARHGGAIVEETLNKIRAIAESAAAVARKIDELGKGSDQIGR
ncbi:MAG TPA: methyl-accepting chemotaxis protein, partial [Terriglobales bacterium]|nr:methyl-accepting chemotaxis protein [Terriglobales bacterium]